MGINDFRKNLPDYAKDIKLNLSAILSEEGAPGLSRKQILGAALAASYAAKDKGLTAALSAEAQDALSPAEIEAAKGAAAIMGMTNIYYRFLHLTSDAEFQKLPANLRMDIIAKHGIEHIDFELMALAVSIVNGCDLCVDSHVKKTLKHGITREGVQSIARIAAVIHAAAGVAFIESL